MAKSIRTAILALAFSALTPLDSGCAVEHDCGAVASIKILNSYGVARNYEEVCADLMLNGRGTSLLQVSQLLERYGIACCAVPISSNSKISGPAVLFLPPSSSQDSLGHFSTVNVVNNQTCSKHADWYINEPGKIIILTHEERCRLEGGVVLLVGRDATRMRHRVATTKVAAIATLCVLTLIYGSLFQCGFSVPRKVKIMATRLAVVMKSIKVKRGNRGFAGKAAFLATAFSFGQSVYANNDPDYWYAGLFHTISSVHSGDVNLTLRERSAGGTKATETLFYIAFDRVSESLRFDIKSDDRDIQYIKSGNEILLHSLGVVGRVLPDRVAHGAEPLDPIYLPMYCAHEVALRASPDLFLEFFQQNPVLTGTPSDRSANLLWRSLSYEYDDGRTLVHERVVTVERLSELLFVPTNVTRVRRIENGPEPFSKLEFATRTTWNFDEATNLARPQKIEMKDFKRNRILEFDYQWKGYNDPIDPSVFTTDGMTLSQGTPLVDLRGPEPAIEKKDLRSPQKRVATRPVWLVVGMGLLVFAGGVLAVKRKFRNQTD